MQVPIGGMALRPFLADANSPSRPFAARGAQAAASPNFGAPATPATWQTEHLVLYSSYTATLGPGRQSKKAVGPRR